MKVGLGYKQTAVGAIPNDWLCEYLRDAAANSANAIVGGPFGSDLVSADYVATGVPVIRGQNMSASFVSGDFVFVPRQKAKSLSANLAHSGDLVFTQRGTLGQVAIVPAGQYESYLVSQSQMKITLNRERHDSSFVYQYFVSRAGQKQIALSAIQTGVPHTNLGILRSYRFPAPALPEQRVIAETLCDVDALLAGLDRLIAKKRNLKQAAMQRLLTGQTRLPGFRGEWEMMRLGELGAIYGGLIGKTKADFGTGMAKYVTFMNVMTNTVIDPTIFDFVRVSPSESQNRVERGDLLFNGSSETPEEVALCALVRCDVSDLYLNSFCFGFRPREGAEVDGLFLTYYIRSAEGREILKSLAQGSTRYNLSKKALLAAEVRLPSLAEQVAIAAVLSDMDAEITSLEARRHKTRAVRQGMMQELLTGRTRLI